MGQRKIGRIVTREAVTIGLGQGEATQMAAEAAWAVTREAGVMGAEEEWDVTEAGRGPRLSKA